VGRDSFDFRLLGDLAVIVDGEPRPLTAARQRGVLAMLLLSANRTVAARALIDGIWGDALPQHPDTALQIVISRLRASLGAASGRLLSTPGGYRIEVEADELDLSLAQAALARGDELRRDHDPERAVAVADAALARWTAEPLHDLVVFPFTGAARPRLRELRIALVELRNDVMLDCARHVEMLETIADWLREEPWRERLRAQQMLALYRCGRQVDALRAYDEYRERLVDELGVEPSHELRELHRDVLSHEPSLAPDVSVVGSSVPLWTSLVLPFVGRRAEVECIFAQLRVAATGRRSMVLVDGEVGIGKTRLVIEVARRVQRDVLVVPVTSNDALRPPLVGLARALVDATVAVPTDQVRVYLGDDPQAIAAVAPALAERLPELAFDGAVDDERLSRALESCAGALSARAPLMLVIDDLHRAGVATLWLLGRLIAADTTDRILVVGTSRSPASSSLRSAALEDLASRLERRHELMRIPLRGLDRESIERLLVWLDEPDAESASELLAEVTGGHPFFLSQVLSTDDWRHALVDPPHSVREFVRRRVHALGNAVEGLLVDASGLMIAFDVPLLAEISGVPRATTANLIDEAVAAGVLRAVDKGTFTFVHEVIRRALQDQLDDGGRARLHERIARTLDGRGIPPALMAWHWGNVPGAEAERQVARYAAATEPEIDVREPRAPESSVGDTLTT
jgi:DNA-binding SARP family transcriptional activator